MKVLWFTNTPSLGAKHINSVGVGGGWIESLEAELAKVTGIQLGIVFNWAESECQSFTVNNTNYFPVQAKIIKGKLKKIYQRWLHKIEPENHLQEYLKIVCEFKPDIIHMFGTETDYGLIISKLDIPCVVHIQGNLIVYNHKWYSGLTKTDVIKYSNKWTLLKGIGLFHDYIINNRAVKREYKILENCQYLMGRTDWDRRMSSVLSPKSKYFHCDEIMRRSFYLFQWKPRSTQNNYEIVTTIRKNIYKGLETVYECKRILEKVFSEYKIIWKIAGISERDEISYLIERKYKGKFKNINIRLLGSLQEIELVNEMIESDLFVLPSHIENSPNSVCEAMLLGMPVIATYAGGTPSIIKDKKEGLLVQDGDPYALAGAIIELIKDREYANSLGSSARERAIQRHNPTKIVHELLAIYSSMIRKR